MRRYHGDDLSNTHRVEVGNAGLSAILALFSAYAGCTNNLGWALAVAIISATGQLWIDIRRSRECRARRG